MGDAPSTDKTEAAKAPVDLSELRDLHFGPAWSDEVAPGVSGDLARQAESDRPRRGGGPPKRDRRQGGRPAGNRPRPQRDGGEGRGRPEGPRGEGRAPRREGGPRRGRPEAAPEAPFEPTVDVLFYPEDAPFKALAKAIRSSYRTFELFEVARTILQKPDRHVAVVRPKNARQNKDAVLYLTQPDEVPYERAEDAIAHVLAHNVEYFFEVEEAEGEAPAGNFPVIHKCGMTGELIGPPNYHRYQELLREHQASRLPNVSLERVEAKLESVKDDESREAWLEKMKKKVTYRLKAEPGFSQPAGGEAEETPAETPEEAPVEAAPEAEAAPAAEAPAEEAPVPAAEAEEATPEAAQEAPEAEEEPAGDAPEEPAAEALEEAAKEEIDASEADTVEVAREGTLPSFESLASARHYMETFLKDRLVQPVDTVRLPGPKVEALPDNTVRRSIVAANEQQMRFPLETSNHLRSRLRRLNFALYKKGTKGVSYVCAVKRRFREEGERLGENVQKLIEFIEARPDQPISKIQHEYLGFSIESEGGENAPAPELSDEQKKAVQAFRRDLHWLVSEGYVTEYYNGTLFAPPARPKPKPKEEGETRKTPDADGDEANPAIEESADSSPSSTEAAASADVEEAASEEPAPKAEEALAAQKPLGEPVDEPREMPAETPPSEEPVAASEPVDERLDKDSPTEESPSTPPPADPDAGEERKDA